MIDYTIFYKEELPLNEDWTQTWDIFVSAYNSSERVNFVFDKVRAGCKDWLMHLEYGYERDSYPTNGFPFSSESRNEAEYIRSYISSLSERNINYENSSICIDITGFMRPHLMFLCRYLEFLGVRKFDVIYSEPIRYSDKEMTTFSDGAIEVVRQVAGFEGGISSNTIGDLLIIGAGYDHKLIEEVAEDKDKAEKIRIFGLPSLRADMYQENVLRAFYAADAVGEHKSGEYFAPANDPFATATVLSEIVAERQRFGNITNLYLSPLATKPQALGFALFYIGERNGTNTSILFPFSASYSKETSGGIARAWKYTVEFPIT